MLTIPSTSASCERKFSLKRVNNYMRCPESKEQLSNKDLLKKMKTEQSADTFYNKVINEFAKKKRRIDLIYK